MRTATALSVIAIGAIFAFAITAHPSFLNLQVVGWVLILTGVCGLVVPRRGRGWLRRSVLVRGAPDITRVGQPGEPGPVLTGHREVASADDPVERESIVEYTER